METTEQPQCLSTRRLHPRDKKYVQTKIESAARHFYFESTLSYDRVGWGAIELGVTVGTSGAFLVQCHALCELFCSVGFRKVSQCFLVILEFSSQPHLTEYTDPHL